MGQKAQTRFLINFSASNLIATTIIERISTKFPSNSLRYEDHDEKETNFLFALNHNKIDFILNDAYTACRLFSLNNRLNKS